MKKNKLPTARKTVKQAWRVWGDFKKQLLLIGLIATVINFLVYMLSEGGTLAVELWFVIVVAATVWLLAHTGKKQKPKLQQVFYEGSSGFIRLLLVFLIWMLYMIPFVIGAALAGQVNLYQFGASSAELIGFNALWLVLSLVSFYWLFRGWLAPLYINDGETPIQAIKNSWTFTRNRMGWVTRTLALALLVAVLPLLVLVAALYLPLPENPLMTEAISLLNSFIGYSFSIPFLIAASYEMKKHHGPKKKYRRKK